VIRIVLVEDSPSQRAYLEKVLRGVRDFQWVGGYPDAEAALAGVTWDQVDVLISDLSLPGASGITLIQRATRRNPALRVLALTVHNDSATLHAALEAGASGYVLKGGTPPQLTEAIRELAKGSTPLSPAVAGHLVAAVRGDKEAQQAAELTPREGELLRLMAAGRSHKEIADALKISPHTVNAHFKNIYAKLQASGRQEALQRARLLGYISRDVS
jgi:two-component system NarL family response regulator